MEEHIITTLEEYIQFVENLPFDFSLSRGQYCDFPLLPTALRKDGNDKRLYSNQVIEGFLDEFHNYSNMYLNEYIHSYTYSKQEFLTMIWAQHYGLPTQLLDFSYSHLISLMFAVEDSFKKEEPDDAIVWFLNPTELNYLSTNKISREIKNISNPMIKRSDFNEHCLPTVVSCVKSNKRVQAQNGDFVYFKTTDNSLESSAEAEKFLLDRLPSSVNGLSHINSASNNAILESGREAPYVQEIAVQRPDFC